MKIIIFLFIVLFVAEYTTKRDQKLNQIQQNKYSLYKLK